MSNQRTKKQAAEDAKTLAREVFSEHKITKVSDNVWRCERADTSIYSFSVVVIPGAIVIYGDIGEAIINQGPRYDLNWLLQVPSRSYLLEKISSFQRDTYYPGEFHHYINEMVVEYAEDSLADGDFNDRRADAERSSYDEDSFRHYMYQTGDTDLTDRVYGYSMGAHFIAEAIECFIRLFKANY